MCTYYDSHSKLTTLNRRYRKEHVPTAPDPEYSATVFLPAPPVIQIHTTATAAPDATAAAPAALTPSSAAPAMRMPLPDKF